ncbi:hypothetical protein V1507DRAFT_447948 [Lipomyces tetrasporus]
MEDGISAMYQRAVQVGISDGFARGFRAELHLFKAYYRQLKVNEAAAVLNDLGGAKGSVGFRNRGDSLRHINTQAFYMTALGPHVLVREGLLLFMIARSCDSISLLNLFTAQNVPNYVSHSAHLTQQGQRFSGRRDIQLLTSNDGYSDRILCHKLYYNLHITIKFL